MLGSASGRELPEHQGQASGMCHCGLSPSNPSGGSGNSACCAHARLLEPGGLCQQLDRLQVPASQCSWEQRGKPLLQVVPVDGSTRREQGKAEEASRGEQANSSLLFTLALKERSQVPLAPASQQRRCKETNNCSGGRKRAEGLRGMGCSQLGSRSCSSRGKGLPAGLGPSSPATAQLCRAAQNRAHGGGNLL